METIHFVGINLNNIPKIKKISWEEFSRKSAIIMREFVHNDSSYDAFIWNEGLLAEIETLKTQIA